MNKFTLRLKTFTDSIFIVIINAGLINPEGLEVMMSLRDVMEKKSNVF